MAGPRPIPSVMRLLLVWAALVGSLLLADAISSMPPLPLQLGAILGAGLVSLAYTTATLTPVLFSSWRGWRLALAVFLIFSIARTLIPASEMFLGDRTLEGEPPDLVLQVYLQGVVAAALFAPLAVTALGRWRGPSSLRPWPTLGIWGWAWRLALLPVAHMVLETAFTAVVRMLLPGDGASGGGFMLQADFSVYLLGSGLMWAGMAILLLRMMDTSWRRATLALVLVLTIPPAIGHLLPFGDQPLVDRLARFFSIAPSQLGYALLLAWLFRPLLGHEPVPPTASPQPVTGGSA